MIFSSQEPLNIFISVDSIRSLLGFNAGTIYEKYNLWPNPLDILLFDNTLLECHFAQGMIFKGKITRTIQYFTIDVDPGYKHIGKIRGGS